MDEKYQKPAIAAGVIVVLIVLIALFTDVPEKISRFFTISGNIATNLMNKTHGDARDLDVITVDYIKTQTGSTSETNEANLPKAFQPMKEYKHPPFSMGACQVCHAPTRSKPAAIVTKTVWDLCYKCHEPADESREAMKPLDCNKCHSPHHADRKKLLRAKVIDRDCPVGEFK